jgi:tRNA modification GTPase
LLGTSRAIVTEIPGTTRDAIEASTDVLGWPVRLVDTAGLREADEKIEQMGIEVSRRYVGAADLLLLCVEAGRDLEDAEHAILSGKPALLVRTKADLVPGSGQDLAVSVVSGGGLDRLRERMREILFGDGATYGDLTPMLTRERHRIALARARDSLQLASPELRDQGDSVLAAHHVRNAVDALDELIGVVHPDDVLGRVFERFCVGK